MRNTEFRGGGRNRNDVKVKCRGQGLERWLVTKVLKYSVPPEFPTRPG